MVGELVIINAMIAQDKSIPADDGQGFTRNISQLGKITRELQDLSISMRMVPLKGLFSKMTRLVRDLSRKSGKQVRFLREGEDTEIDRNMVESLSDPLIHMIRNGVDHGLEKPETRRSQGKPDEGTLLLRAYHAAGNVVIELQDDGRGLDRDKILAKAVENGLVEGDKELPDGEVFKLIFAPGFSTADQVTQISGRGVGMDVVKRNIEAMRGRVEVSSTKGEGSLFTIRIPLTLAIIDGMLLKVGREHYLVPTLNVNQAYRPEPDAVSTVQGKGEMVMLRGTLIPLFRLHRIFEVTGAIEDVTEAIVIVVENEGEKCAVLVDQLLGQQQVVIKSLGKGLGEVEGLSGAAILGDGRVGLILDVAGMIRIAKAT
jgi:two-component system chemotaxis sensor kinase CheA